MDTLRVFIVDDDQDFAESLALLIEGRGYQAEVAFSGEEAIAKFREQDFDITFMDVRLPGKNGTESFLEIRKFKPSARVVMMTGYSVEQLLEQAIEHGAWGVLDKPIDVRQLLEMLENLKQDIELDAGQAVREASRDYYERTKARLYQLADEWEDEQPAYVAKTLRKMAENLQLEVKKGSEGYYAAIGWEEGKPAGVEHILFGNREILPVDLFED